MIVFLKKDLIKNICKKWKAQYPTDKKDITDQLERLNPKTEDGITAIIGNDSWTKNVCDECKKDMDALLYVCEDYDDDYSHYVLVCVNCLRKGEKMIKTAIKNGNTHP